MTEKLKPYLIFGLLAWGLFAFLPNTAHAQEWVGYVGSKVGNSGPLGGSLGEIGGAQIIRKGGQEAVDKAAEMAGYKSKNIKAVTNEHIKEQAGNISITKAAGAHVSGAANAAAARWKGSSNAVTGAWNVVTGGIADIFRSRSKIAESLEDYRTADNADNIDAANAAAAELAKQKDSAKAIAKAAAVYETADGQKIYMDVNMKSVGGLMDGCVPLPLKLEQSKKCILCPLFVILFNTAQSMSIVSYAQLAEGFKNLMLIGFALYIAYVTLKQVSSFTKQDGPKFVSELLVMSFKVLLAYLILTHVSELYRLVLEPLLNAAMEFGGAFLFRSASSNSASSFMTCAASTNMPEGATIIKGFYSEALFAKVNCFVTSVQQELAVATSIGSSLMCVSRNEAAHWYGLWDLTMFSSGLIIWVFSWLTCLAFGFYLIDAVIRLGVVGGLMPFLIAAWPFKLTSGYTKKGWDMFMNTFFTFVFLGIVVSVNIELSLQAVTGGEGGYDAIMKLVNSNEVKPIVDIMSIGLMGLLFLILCCIFGFKLTSEAVSLAAQMSGGSPGNLGSTIASAGAGAAKWGTTRTLKGVGAVGKSVGEASGVNEKIRSGKEVVSRKFYNGVGAVGKSLGLKGTGGDSGSGGNGGGSGGNGGNGGGNADAQSSQRRPGQNGQQQTDNDRRNGTPADIQGAPAQEEQNRTAQEGQGSGGARTPVDANAEQNVHNATPAGDNGDTNGSERSGGQSYQEEQHTDAARSQNTEPTNDGGAAAAGEASPELKAQADQLVGDSKSKLGAAAEEAATRGRGDRKPSAAENSSRGKTEGGNKADAQKARAEIDTLRKTISGLQIEIEELKKKLKDKGTTTGSAGTVGLDNEQMKKLEEEKKKAESRLSSLLEVLKNQK